MVKALTTGVHEGSFTKLRVLRNGEMIDIIDLVAGIAYDDEDVIEDIASNAARHNGKHMGAIASGPDPLTSDVARSECWAPAKIS